MEKDNGKSRNRHQYRERTTASVRKEDLTEEERIRERRRRRRALQRKRQRQRRMILIVMALAAVVIITAAVRGIAGHFSSSKPSASGTDKETTADASGSSVSGGDKTEQETASSKSSPKDTLKAAELKATQYDYDGAIELLKADTSYSSDSDMQSAVKKYEEAKASCKSWPLEEVTHVFYHILIKDPSKAFDGDYKEADYNQVMTTIDEFNKITQTMYDKGYVMVSIKDMATVNEDGTMSPGEILLPEGKIPFVLSQDDVCYYHYMDGDGFASKLVVDDEGRFEMNILRMMEVYQ